MYIIVGGGLRFPGAWRNLESLPDRHKHTEGVRWGGGGPARHQRARQRPITTTNNDELPRTFYTIYIYFLNAPTGLTIRIDTSDKSPQKKIDNNSQIHSWLATMQNPTCRQSFLVLHLTTIPASHYITKAQNKANHAPVYELFPAIYKHWCW